MLGFDTIGNATLIAYDNVPILATDVWIEGGAYFGSWGFSHDIPGDQLASIRKCRYLWYSHGHPDHLSAESLSNLSDKEILLANHVGGRIARDLTNMGFRTRVLPEREWIPLSPRIRVMTLSDYNQDSILLVDINGTLLVDVNDASDRGWGGFVKKIAQGFQRSFLLKLGNYGDADMINLFDDEGKRILPPTARKHPVGKMLSQWANRLGTTHVIPFSSFHTYQREDSLWADQYTTPLSAYPVGFDHPGKQLLPAFVHVDCSSANGPFTELRPPENHRTVRPPGDFGDHWSDPLEPDERRKLVKYFEAKTALHSHFGFIRFVVGGQETTIDMHPRMRDFGLTFAAPRASLMTAVEYKVFDDLLIGNFMKTTLHGGAKLYPHFTPMVAKYSDNGLADTPKELRAYLIEYFRRDPVGVATDLIELKSEDVFRKLVPFNSGLHKAAKKLYWKLR